MKEEKYHKNTMLKILLIGPCPPPIHGTTVSFQQLIDHLKRRKDIVLTVIDTSRKTSEFKFLDTCIVILKTFSKLCIQATKVDVITFHASSKAALLFGAIIHIVCSIYGKPWILRVFGGNFHKCYARHSKRLQHFFLRTSVSADRCLFQTKTLVEYFRKFNKSNIYWFPNSRDMADMKVHSMRNVQCIKFVYVGNINYSKGILDIVSASRLLPDSVTIDVYGPFQDGITEDIFKGSQRTKYRGIIDPQAVIRLLKNYDALLLPTHYEGEGYPGVILEAYAAGIPVIASDWQAIAEIVDHTSGILIEPRSPENLSRAMRRLISNPALYRRLRRGVTKKRMLYSSKKWVNQFVKHCEALKG